MDKVMDERWNTIEAAEMALGIRQAMDCVRREEECPSKYEKYLAKGIEFLEEAEAGGALISGAGPDKTASFRGDFSPLCMATDVYITFRDTPDKSSDYAEVSKVLSGYRNTLVKITDTNVKSEITEASLKQMEVFFEGLFDMLAERSDPIMQDYSRPYGI